MLLSVVQFSPVFGNIEKNYDLICGYIENSKSDIIVFPELCLTGYDFISRQELDKHSLDFGGEVINSIAGLSQKHNRIIILGFPEKQSDELFNSAAILFPDKSFNRVYRKTHLFYREFLYFEPGDTGFFVIDYKDFDLKIGAMICYDWRFPEAARSLGLLGADLIACPSNLVTDVWQISMPSRALENKVYLALANRFGMESRNGDELLFKGNSAIYDYSGNILSAAAADNQIEITAEIYPKRTRNKSFNSYNDIFKDRKKEFYIF